MSEFRLGDVVELMPYAIRRPIPDDYLGKRSVIIKLYDFYAYIKFDNDEILSADFGDLKFISHAKFNVGDRVRASLPFVFYGNAFQRVDGEIISIEYLDNTCTVKTDNKVGSEIKFPVEALKKLVKKKKVFNLGDRVSVDLSGLFEGKIFDSEHPSKVKGVIGFIGREDEIKNNGHLYHKNTYFVALDECLSTGHTLVLASADKITKLRKKQKKPNCLFTYKSNASLIKENTKKLNVGDRVNVYFNPTMPFKGTIVNLSNATNDLDYAFIHLDCMSIPSSTIFVKISECKKLKPKSKNKSNEVTFLIRDMKDRIDSISAQVKILSNYCLQSKFRKVRMQLEIATLKLEHSQQALSSAVKILEESKKKNDCEKDSSC